MPATLLPPTNRQYYRVLKQASRRELATWLEYACMISMAFGQYLHRLTLLILLCLGAPLPASGETPGQTLPQEVLAQARAFETAKQYDRAIASYRTYLALRPDDDEARGALARVLSWQGHYDEAVALYEDIL